MRLIDADALDDEIAHFFLAITGNPKQATVVRECKKSFQRMIEEQPTVYEVDKVPKMPEEVADYIEKICDKESRDRVFRRCICDYGSSSQIDVAIEEMSELIKALLKWKRADFDGLATARAAIIDELADVRIMVRQMEILFLCEDEVERRIDFKVQRQWERLEGNGGES